ncbi:hypothetical protein [Glycomyces tarimensis]
MTILQGRQHHVCDLPRFPLAEAEKAVAAHYATFAVTEAERAEIEQHLNDAVNSREITTKAPRQRLRSELTRLSHLEDQCLDLIGQHGWPTEKLTDRLKDINLERDKIKQSLDEATAVDLETARQRLTSLLRLLDQPRALFEALPDDLRKTLGALCFEKLHLDADDSESPRIGLDEPATHVRPLREHLQESRACGYQQGKTSEPRAPKRCPGFEQSFSCRADRT